MEDPNASKLLQEKKDLTGIRWPFRFFASSEFFSMLNSYSAPATMKDLTFLTRDGCVNTPDTLNNLDDALTALKLPKDYQFIDIAKLPKTDPRTG